MPTPPADGYGSAIACGWPFACSQIVEMGTYALDMFWLNATNIAMGAVALLCAAAVLRAVVREVLHRR